MSDDGEVSKVLRDILGAADLKGEPLYCAQALLEEAEREQIAPVEMSFEDTELCIEDGLSALQALYELNVSWTCKERNACGVGKIITGFVVGDDFIRYWIGEILTTMLDPPDGFKYAIGSVLNKETLQ